MSAATSCALLDPVSSARRARPLHHWPKARQEAVRVHFAEIHRAWCADWLPASGTAASSDSAVWLSDSVAETAFVPEGTTIFWSFVDASVVTTGCAAVHAIARAMFGSDAVRDVPGIANGAARAAWNDWLRRLAALPVPEASGLQEVAPPKGGVAARPWSGALWLRWCWCGGLWRLALPHEVVAAWASGESAKPAPPALADPSITRLDQALARERITLRTVLGGAELTLGQLQSLRIGDVIPLAHRLDAPLNVVTAEGAALCEGWLGQRQGRVAIEMSLPDLPRTNNPSLKGKNP